MMQWNGSVKELGQDEARKKLVCFTSADSTSHVFFAFQVFSGLKNSFIFVYLAPLTFSRCWNPTDH